MLNSEQIEKLQGVLRSSGWTEVVKPVLAERGNSMIKALVRPASERAEPFKSVDENFLRGQIAAIEWMVSVWENEVRAYQHNQRLDELDRQTQSGQTDLTPANP